MCPKCGEHKMVKGTLTAGGKRRWVCQESTGDRAVCYQTTDPTAAYRGGHRLGSPEKKLVFDGKISKRARLVITWAQNATPVHEGFFSALRAYCKENSADLIVIPGRYKNPTSAWEASQSNMQEWAQELKPYLINTRKALNKNLMLLADISTQPTAGTPLSGFESITHGESGILGHPKLQMVVIPTPHQRTPKIMTTTGAITTENYSDSKVGKKGEHHHVQGAVIVELDGKAFHLRHVNARADGAFCDLERAYFPDGTVKPAGAYEALVFGDTHVRFSDKSVDVATFGEGGLVEKLNPKALVFHDLLDGYAVNPHHQFKPFVAVAKHNASFTGIEMEIREAMNWLDERSRGRQAYIVASNHNDFLTRWMSNHDWRIDPENAEFYLETALHMVRGSRMANTGSETPDPFHYWISKLNADNIHCVGRNESLMISDVECSLHGDQGPNGARGSRNALAKIGAKTIIGHSHTPGITAGCYQVGTSTPLSLEYTGAVGSWLNCHGSVDPMGKRHLHICIGGKFWR